MNTPDWQSDDGAIQLHCCDCMELLPTMEAGAVDVVVSDPPYGISYDASHDKYKKGIARTEADWDVAPFDPRPILDMNLPTVLWGGNCFASRLPDHPGWLCWRKTVRNDAKIRQADMELAWTNCVRRSRTFQHLWIGAYRESESGVQNVHPTQKPIVVMAWCIGIVSNEGSTIFDPYMGSGTTGVACVRTGRRFIGIEKEREYFDVAVKRIKRELAQPRLPFVETAKEEQAEMYQ